MTRPTHGHDTHIPGSLPTWIKRSGKTPARVADEIGITPELLAQITSGEVRMPIELVDLFARALAVKPLTMLANAVNDIAPRAYVSYIESSMTA